MSINKVKHDKRDWSIDTSLYLQSNIKVLIARHFTYSQIPEREQNFRKALIISYRVSALHATKFSRIILLSFLDVSQKSKLKLISDIFGLPMISRCELSITLNVLCSLWTSTQCSTFLPASLCARTVVVQLTGPSTSRSITFFRIHSILFWVDMLLLPSLVPDTLYTTERPRGCPLRKKICEWY